MDEELKKKRDEGVRKRERMGSSIQNAAVRALTGTREKLH